MELKEWCRRKLGGYKLFVYVFWLGEDGVLVIVFLIGSGKVRKFEMVKLGDELLVKRDKVKL